MSDTKQLVPCEHRTMRITHPDQFSCADCGMDVPDPRGCRHFRIDNNTEQCKECGERMLTPHPKVVTVLSAPNKAACSNPECSGDISDPNCENPGGLYVPDHSREQRIPIRTDYTYTCQRCANDGTLFVSGEPLIWECGRDHRGDSVPIRAADAEGVSTDG